MLQLRRITFYCIPILLFEGILLLQHFPLIGRVDTTIHARIEAQFLASNVGTTPFWIRSLQYGQVPMENPGQLLGLGQGRITI